MNALAGVGPAKVESPDKGPLLKKSALILKCLPKWPSVKSDLHGASENGLTAAAKAPAHGEWYEGAALDWARKKGKLSEANQMDALGASLHLLPGRIHRIEP